MNACVQDRAKLSSHACHSWCLRGSWYQSIEPRLGVPPRTRSRECLRRENVVISNAVWEACAGVEFVSVSSWRGNHREVWPMGIRDLDVIDDVHAASWCLHEDVCVSGVARCAIQRCRPQRAGLEARARGLVKRRSPGRNCRSAFASSTEHARGFCGSNTHKSTPPLAQESFYMRITIAQG